MSVPKYFYSLEKVFPRKFVKHYLRPMFFRDASAYEPESFFDDFFDKQNYGDRDTIAPDVEPYDVLWHYNAVENGILETLMRFPANADRILDIGPGAGHWIDFYLSLFPDARMVGVDISESVITHLKEKYGRSSEVKLVHTDIGSRKMPRGLSGRFQIINAIGVMFHIVDDSLWAQALRNISKLLDERGLLIVGGQFGWLTRNVQFVSDGEGDRFNKRIRSLNYWRSVCSQVGLRVLYKHETPEIKGIRTPENNLLVIAKI